LPVRNAQHQRTLQQARGEPGPVRPKQSQALMVGMLELVTAHYRRGPESPARVLEALNALAYATATVLGGTEGDAGTVPSPQAEAFFAEALRDATVNLRKMKI
jgi:hypothetical protein